MLKTDPKFTSEQILKLKDKRIATLEFQLDQTKKQLRSRNNDLELYKGTIQKLTESVGKFMATDIERYQMKEKALAELEELKSTHQHYSKSTFSGKYEKNQQLIQEAMLNREKI